MATARPLELLSGRYRLGALLGQGGMAEVFSAEDLRLGRGVAVKMLRPQLGADPTVRYRFEQEARTAARLSHPNIVGIIDTGEDEGVAFIIMERLPGSTLADELEGGPLGEQRIRDVAHQVLAALEAAHGAGIVHRDIKPANVLTCPDGRVKVADFGIATAMDEAQAITSTGLLIGTPAYVAPERLAGAPATPASDLYSLSSVLYQCLTGRRPFEGVSTVGLISAVRELDPEPVRAYRPDADPRLVDTVERGLSKDPAARPQSARAMSELLEGAAASHDAERARVPERTRVLLYTDPTPPSTRIHPDAAASPTLALPASRSRWARLRSDLLAPAARHTSARLASVRAVGRRYRIALAFLGAAFLALVIALPLAASSGTSTPGGTTGSGSHVAPRLSPMKGVPSSLARAIDNLDRAVGS